MKRIIALILSLLLVFALVGCTSEKTDETEKPTESTVPSDSTEPTEPAVSVADPVELLSTVWGSYAEDEKFAVIGGDFSEENNNPEGPGRYSMEDVESLDYALALPADAAALVDDAASLSHMMNANTFTCGAFRVTEAANVTSVVELVKENVMNREWMCGFPDKLVVITLDNYVVSVFGNAEMVDTFVSKTQAAYETASVVCDEPLV